MYVLHQILKKDIDEVSVEYVSGSLEALIFHAHLSVKVTALLTKDVQHLKVEGLLIKGKEEMSTAINLISPEDIGSFVRVNHSHSEWVQCVMLY